MDKYGYQIIRQGRRDDGRTWADYTYTYGGKERKVHIKLRAGVNLESRIRKAVKDDVDSHERREAITPEENEELDRRAANYRRRHPGHRDFL